MKKLNLILLIVIFSIPLSLHSIEGYEEPTFNEGSQKSQGWNIKQQMDAYQAKQEQQYEESTTTEPEIPQILPSNPEPSKFGKFANEPLSKIIRNRAFSAPASLNFPVEPKKIKTPGDDEQGPSIVHEPAKKHGQEDAVPILMEKRIINKKPSRPDSDPEEPEDTPSEKEGEDGGELKQLKQPESSNEDFDDLMKQKRIAQRKLIESIRGDKDEIITIPESQVEHHEEQLIPNIAEINIPQSKEEMITIPQKR